VSANTIAGRAFVNTQYATAISLLTWNVMEVIFSPNGWFKGQPTAVGAACGAVTGLVAITPACGYVSNMWAYGIGVITVAVVFFMPRAMKPWGVDDRLDCFAVHGIGGMTGALLTGLFASAHEQQGSTAPTDGAFYYNAPQYAK